MCYDSFMSTTTLPQEPAIEQRLAALEQQMADILRLRSVPAGVADKNWLNTVGTRKDDAFSREADQLGEAWRQSVTD